MLEMVVLQTAIKCTEVCLLYPQSLQHFYHKKCWIVFKAGKGILKNNKEISEKQDEDQKYISEAIEGFQVQNSCWRLQESCPLIYRC